MSLRTTLVMVFVLLAGCRSKERCAFQTQSTEQGCTVRGDLFLRSGGIVNLKGSFGCGEQFERCGVTRICKCEPDAGSRSFDSTTE